MPDISGTLTHYDDVIMGAMESQITSLTVVYSTVYSDADQRKHQSSTSLAFVRRIHRGPVTGLCAGNSPVTGEFPAQMASNAENVSAFDDVIMNRINGSASSISMDLNGFERVSKLIRRNPAENNQQNNLYAPIQCFVQPVCVLLMAPQMIAENITGLRNCNGDTSKKKYD